MCGSVQKNCHSLNIFHIIQVLPIEPSSLLEESDISKSGTPPREEEIALIRAAQNGDLRAFEKLVHQYQQRVVVTAYRLVQNWEDAKDIAQEVFVRVYRSLSGFHRERKFFTWLYRIIINVCWDFLRQQKRFHPTSLNEALAQGAESTASYDIAGRETTEKIMELIHQLSTPQKTVFLLREIEGFSCKEIARILQMPAGTIRSHLFHARRILQQMIRKEYPEFLEGIAGGAMHEK